MALASDANRSTQIEEETADLDDWPLQPPRSPVRSIASATSVALLSQSTPPLPEESESYNPPFYLKTPPGSHKKLPKPPHSLKTPSLLFAQEEQPFVEGIGVQKTSSLRSLLESICSSYAKQDGMPEQGYGAEIGSAKAEGPDLLGLPMSRLSSDDPAVRDQ